MVSGWGTRIEPRMAVPKTAALPLGYAPNSNFDIS